MSMKNKIIYFVIRPALIILIYSIIFYFIAGFKNMFDWHCSLKITFVIALWFGFSNNYRSYKIKLLKKRFGRE